MTTESRTNRMRPSRSEIFMRECDERSSASPMPAVIVVLIILVVVAAVIIHSIGVLLP